jgi:voltage-gated potassium channel
VGSNPTPAASIRSDSLSAMGTWLVRLSSHRSARRSSPRWNAGLTARHTTIHRVLQHTLRGAPAPPQLWRALDIAVIAAAVAVIPALVLDGLEDPTARDIAYVLDWVSWSVFGTEVVARLLFDPHRRAWVRSEWFMIAVTVVTFPLLPAGLAMLRLARLTRLLRLLRLLRLMPATHRLRRLLSPEGLRHVVLIAALVIVGGAAIFAHAEDRSFGISVWWAIVTSATVGYGDIYPVTTLGRITGVAVMVAGISVFAIGTGAIAQTFLAAQTETLREDTVAVGHTEERLLARVEALRIAVSELESELRNARPPGAHDLHPEADQAVPPLVPEARYSDG